MKAAFSIFGGEECSEWLTHPTPSWVKPVRERLKLASNVQTATFPFVGCLEMVGRI